MPEVGRDDEEDGDAAQTVERGHDAESAPGARLPGLARLCRPHATGIVSRRGRATDTTMATGRSRRWPSLHALGRVVAQCEWVTTAIEGADAAPKPLRFLAAT